MMIFVSRFMTSFKVQNFEKPVSIWRCLQQEESAIFLVSRWPMPRFFFATLYPVHFHCVIAWLDAWDRSIETRKWPESQNAIRQYTLSISSILKTLQFAEISVQLTLISLSSHCASHIFIAFSVMFLRHVLFLFLGNICIICRLTPVYVLIHILIINKELFYCFKIHFHILYILIDFPLFLLYASL